MKTHPFARIDYIRIDSLPQAWQREFADWLWGQTRPVMPSELDADGKPALCAYRWDYEHWLAAFRAVNGEALDIGSSLESRTVAARLECLKS